MTTLDSNGLEGRLTAIDLAIKAGDDRLREHVTNQITQIQAALEAADKLELARIERVAEKATATQNVANVRQEGASVAISKAEVATTKLFESVTERVQQVQQWQAKMVGALALAVIFVPLITGVAVYLLTRHAIAVAPAAP